MLTPIFFQIPLAVDVNEQALRAADAGWETARWTFWLFVATALLVLGAGVAAYFAWKTWTATKGQLDVAEDQLLAAQTERDNSNAQLEMARRSALEREAVNVSVWLFDHAGYIDLYLRNGNSGPIYEVTCEVLHKPDRQTQEPSVAITNWTRMAVAPLETMAVNQSIRQPHCDDYVLEYIDPDTNIEYNKNRKPVAPVKKAQDWRIWNGSPGSTGLAVKLYFRDSAGVYWQRDWHGKLTAVTKN